MEKLVNSVENSIDKFSSTVYSPRTFSAFVKLTEQWEERMIAELSKADRPTPGFQQLRRLLPGDKAANDDKTWRRELIDEKASKEKKQRYWEPHEHKAFLECIILRVDPTNYRLIADIVGTRTADQVRNHAQKYSIKLAKGRGRYHMTIEGGVRSLIEVIDSVQPFTPQEIRDLWSHVWEARKITPYTDQIFEKIAQQKMPLRKPKELLKKYKQMLVDTMEAEPHSRDSNYNTAKSTIKRKQPHSTKKPVNEVSTHGSSDNHSSESTANQILPLNSGSESPLFTPLLQTITSEKTILGDFADDNWIEVISSKYTGSTRTTPKKRARLSIGLDGDGTGDDGTDQVDHEPYDISDLVPSYTIPATDQLEN